MKLIPSLQTKKGTTRMTENEITEPEHNTDAELQVKKKFEEYLNALHKVNSKGISKEAIPLLLRFFDEQIPKITAQATAEAENKTTNRWLNAMDKMTWKEAFGDSVEPDVKIMGMLHVLISAIKKKFYQDKPLTKE